ncbi:DUF349 domain-containing protein [Microbacterium sp. Marseille-Q6965]|uniref:DUF349 domain-containing protein n=1 Tax=Microbacterium sp. Marseille-Q6965 TaxID=2965072 RepID=UPI0028E0A3B2|nr:DUF349 domain-containing protein [Microbacterium sp. Marseille-Q6965]
MSTSDHTPESAPVDAGIPADDAPVTAAADDAVAPAPSEPGPERSDAPEEASSEQPADETEPAAPATESAPATPAPSPAPRPTPRPVPSPAALARPKAPAAPAPVVARKDYSEWGRIEDNGAVSVREGDEWRVVGEYPDGTPDEALQYFGRKFDDLEVRVVTLEQRHARGGASASDLRKQAAALKDEVVGAAAVGDLLGLAARLDALTSELAAASEEEAAANRAAVEAAVAERTGIVERVEALAARDPKTVQWKQASSELDALFAAWQQHQKTGPRLPKATAQALWKRFRDARATFERHRRAFFAELDEAHKEARDRKTRIVERAEELASRGEEGIPAYRALLDEWKAAGRAGRKIDDALWARFKAAGDVLYGARAERDQAEQAESAPRIAAREELLVEAQGVAAEKDLVAARRMLTDIQRRWDEVGRIFPREAERALDDRLRRIEQDLKAREDVDWKKNNPETKARANDMAQQLQDSISKLEAELAAAEAAGDKRAAAEAREALDVRRAWLNAIG